MEIPRKTIAQKMRENAEEAGKYGDSLEIVKNNIKNRRVQEINYQVSQTKRYDPIVHELRRIYTALDPLTNRPAVIE